MARSLEKTPKRASNIKETPSCARKNRLEHRKNNRFVPGKQENEKPQKTKCCAELRVALVGSFFYHKRSLLSFTKGFIAQCSTFCANENEIGSSSSFSA